MSTYFYLACRTCRRFVPLASTHGGRASGLSGDEWLRAFAVAHGDEHELFSTSEHDDSLADFIEVDAESSNNDERSRFYDNARWPADSALIAATPDLLAACDLALDVMERVAHTVDREELDAVVELAALARAAIAKAKGEKP